MPSVLNASGKIPEGAVYIGRPSPFGNPFLVGREGTRTEVIAKFEEYLWSNPELMELVKTELAGKDLVCYCAPKPCHGDILLFLANNQTLF